MWKIVSDSSVELLEAGIKYTIPLTIISFFIGIIIATVTALLRTENYRNKKYFYRLLLIIIQKLLEFYVWLFRSTPLLVQLFVVFYGLPSIGIRLSAWVAGITTFSLNVGAYCSETIRAGIQAVPYSQWEAAESLGMSRYKVIVRIILPQVMRIVTPPLANSFIGLVKDTSLASVITLPEMFAVSQQIASQNYKPLLMYLLVAFYYAIFCTILNLIQRIVEKKFNRGKV